MKKFFNVFEKIFIGLLAFGILFSSFQVSAAEKNEKKSDAMKIFREMVTATSKADDRIFHEDIYFVVPQVQIELDMFGKADGKIFKSVGEFDLWTTSKKGESENFSVPFYMGQEGKDFKIYWKMENEWKQFVIPNFAAELNKAVATTNQDDIEKTISQVKDATVLQDNDEQITMLVTLDGEKISEEINELEKKYPTKNETAAEKEIQETFSKYLDTALKNSNIWYVWTVDKKNKQTTAVGLHLSELIQQLAYAALNDKNPNLEPFRDMIETVAFYSDTKAYTTFLGADAESRLEIPKEALNAKKVEVDSVVKNQEK